MKLFAALREQAGVRERELDLADGARVGDVWPALGLGEEPAGLVYAVNRSYVDRSAELAEGDEVAVIPPVSGRRLPALRGAALARARRGRGRVRRRGGDRDLRRDDPLALAGPRRRPARVRGLRGDGRGGDGADRSALRERHDIVDVAIHHRVGPVEIGETSVVIAVSAAHRAAALEACREAIDTLKQTVPLWKKELYVGGEEWIGQGS